MKRHSGAVSRELRPGAGHRLNEAEEAMLRKTGVRLVQKCFCVCNKEIK